MGIFKKLDEIRRKPERVRMKYLYGAVTISMFLIIIIWLFSLKLELADINSGIKSNNESLKNNVTEMVKPPQEVSSIKKRGDSKDDSVRKHDNRDNLSLP